MCYNYIYMCGCVHIIDIVIQINIKQEMLSGSSHIGMETRLRIEGRDALQRCSSKPFGWLLTCSSLEKIIYK